MTGDLITDIVIASGNWEAVAFGFTQVFARTAAATIMLPGIGESAAPSMLRAGFALSISVLVSSSLSDQLPGPPEMGLDAAATLITEVTTGFIFGWLARLWAQSLAISAQFIAYFLNVSSVLQPDPELGPQSTALARTFDLAAPVIILASGTFMLPLRALKSSYTLVPAGTFFPTSLLAGITLNAIAHIFELALQLASPFLVASVVWNVAVGLLSRLVPRMQVYIISLPGQVVGGLVLLSLSVTALLNVWLRGVQTGLTLTLVW